MTNDGKRMPHAGSDMQDAPRSTQHVSRITGSTRLVGIIGWPVSHSLSPRMHNVAYAALGLDWAYVPLPVPPEHVGDAVRGLVALGFAGANVTVPHKQAVIPFMDELTPIARAVGAVNTIVVRPDGSLLGDSTDGAGFMADLRAQMANGEWRIGNVLVIGAGGAARAVVYALAEADASVSDRQSHLGTRSRIMSNHRPRPARGGRPAERTSLPKRAGRAGGSGRSDRQHDQPGVARRRSAAVGCGCLIPVWTDRLRPDLQSLYRAAGFGPDAGRDGARRSRHVGPPGRPVGSAVDGKRRS